MLQIKHYSGLSDLADVTGNAAKGSFEIAVSNTTNIHVGDWVCLYALNNDPDFVAEEIAPHPLSDLDDKANIKLEGANVIDYHQVTAVSNGKLTFAEPIMRKVEAKYNWKIKKYPHYENVGVEDLTFQGKAVKGFEHHEETPDGGSFDGDYKLIDFSRLTNSWMRRVNFVSVSEAASIISSANFSAYDIEISGNRGHSAVRSNSSSRVFIGKVYDHSSGYRIPKAGQLAEWDGKCRTVSRLWRIQTKYGSRYLECTMGRRCLLRSSRITTACHIDRPLYRRFHSQPSRWRPIRSS